MRTQFPLFPTSQEPPTTLETPSQAVRAIEDESFPFERLSDIAEIESWRKEISRPNYHIHKWWAQRLGSVFRGIVIGAFAPQGSSVLDLFYSPVRLHNVTVFDPFMGSGTTIGETLKMGGRAIGRDINPVAYFLVRNSLSLPRLEELAKTFREIQRDVASEIGLYYQARLPNGRKAQVLYYFWVKQVACPSCEQAVDLFSSYIFAQHAYPKQYPDARSLCPTCGAVNAARYDAQLITCGCCHQAFDPSAAPARGTKAHCPKCSEAFAILKAVRRKAEPPSHRLYAKLVLTNSGEKIYLPADDFDRDLYEEAKRKLDKRAHDFPLVGIQPGYNTNQVLNYGYKYWHQFFNARQLLCLSILAERIRNISDERQREVFCCLFSGVLEFNNMFTSFKGEGTGAVRHMFYHHILKPERTPLEANAWGTPKSSGSFSTLFETRIVRAFDYCENPFELRPVRNGTLVSSEKVYELSLPLFHCIASSFAQFVEGASVYLSCGDSAYTDLATESVDAVITDPPFFDNVHYSQLADFFYVWQRHILGEREYNAGRTTRSEAEVQQSNPDVFVERLAGVWRECNRVLKRDGVLIFTYHHSRREGWRCLLASLLKAGFAVVRAHPIKSEMSVATPKHQARDPIDLDMIFVCRKKNARPPAPRMALQRVVAEASKEAQGQLDRLRNTGRIPGRGDIRVILMAQVVARLCRFPENSDVLEAFDSIGPFIEAVLARAN